jgi:predicted ester cyclase
MSAEQNLRLVRHFLEKAWNQQDLSVIDRLIAQHHVAHGPYTTGLPAGPAGQRLLIAEFIRAMPDLSISVERIEESHNVVRAHLTCRGTHLYDLMDIPATGKMVMFKLYFACRIVSGQLVESSAEWDPQMLLRPSRAAARG